MTSSCESKQDSPYLNPDQQSHLKAPFVRGMPESDKWRLLYSKMFPGETVPSPYKNEWSMDNVTRMRSAIEEVLTTPQENEGSQQTIERILDVISEMMRNFNDAYGDGQESSRQVRDGIEYSISGDAMAELRNMIGRASAGDANFLEDLLGAAEMTDIPPRDSATDVDIGAADSLMEDANIYASLSAASPHPPTSEVSSQQASTVRGATFATNRKRNHSDTEP
ncbi:hypothetical protein V8C35DRAFT_250373 [Trichoderma chlorosporum]